MGIKTQIPWPLGALALIVAATGSCGLSPDPIEPELPAESTRTLTIVCWQQDEGQRSDLSDAGKGKAEGRIELHRKNPVKAWFNGDLVPSFDAFDAGKMARGLLEKNAGNVSIYVYDPFDQGRNMLTIISRASMVCEEADVVFRVEYRRGGRIGCPRFGN